MQDAQVVQLQFRPQGEKKWTPLPALAGGSADFQIGDRVYSVSISGHGLKVRTTINGGEVGVGKRIPGFRGVQVKVAGAKFYLRSAPPPGWPAPCVKSYWRRKGRAFAQRRI